MHAFELNGMRCHKENREVLRLADAWDQVLISGGDRHGCEPNALLNLTSAADFPEFVDEIRNGRQSTVVILPQYGQPFGWRMYQNFTHVIADYPSHPESRRQWDQRTFHPNRAGDAVVPMRQLWSVGPPEFLKRIFALALAATHLPVAPLFRRQMAAENQSLVLPRSWATQDAMPEPFLTALDGQPHARLDDYRLGHTETAAD